MFCATTNLLVAILKRQCVCVWRGGGTLGAARKQPCVVWAKEAVTLGAYPGAPYSTFLFPLPILGKGTKCKVAPTPTLSMMSPVTI